VYHQDTICKATLVNSLENNTHIIASSTAESPLVYGAADERPGIQGFNENEWY